MADHLLKPLRFVIPDGAERQPGTHNHDGCKNSPGIGVYGSRSCRCAANRDDKRIEWRVQ